MIRRYVFWWWTCRDCNKPSERSWARQVVSAPAFVSEQELLKTEFGNDFLLRFGILHGCFAVFGRIWSAVGNISLLRGRRSGPFDEAELCLLRFLMPHLETATRLSERFARLRSESEARRVALDQMALGVIFLDAKGNVLSMNEAATNIFLQNDQSITLRHARLYAQNPSEDKKLQGLIYKACQTGRTLSDSGGGTLVVSKKHSPGVVHVLVGPAFDRQGSNSNGPVAVVFIADPGARIHPPNEILHGLYGLTPAECRLALLLGSGRSLCEIAQMLNLCRSTVKSQLDAIFVKTGTRRQSQLMRMLVLLPQQSYRG